MSLILFVFAGRRPNLEAQRPFIDKILEQHPDAEYHLWDLTRTPEDAEYVRAQASDRIKVWPHLHPGHPIQCTKSRSSRRSRCACMIHRPPYEKPYAHYAADEYAGSTFIKLDDDVVFLETRHLGDLIAPLVQHPNAVISANVVNNVVAAKHDSLLAPMIAKRFRLGDPGDRANDKAWWRLHVDAKFAQASHDWFLNDWRHLTDDDRVPTLVHSRPGERISINTIAFTHHTVKRMVGMINREPSLGDEGAIDRMLPRIATGFRVAHLTFGPQDTAMTKTELDDIRSRYAVAGAEYLA